MITCSKLCMESIVFIVFGVHVIILFITKVKILMLVELSLRSSLSMFTSEPRMVGVFWAHSTIYCKHLSFWCMFVDPHLATYFSNIRVQIIGGLESYTSILTCVWPYCVHFELHKQCWALNHLGSISVVWHLWTTNSTIISCFRIGIEM